MRHFQPTVRQLTPLGRRDHAALIVSDHVEALARDAEPRSERPTLSAPLLSRRRRWLAARAGRTA